MDCRFDGTIPYHPKSKNPQITVTIKLTRLRSAVILIAEKDVGSLTSPLPFVRPAPTCLTLAMLTMTTAYPRILGTNRKDALHTPSIQLPDSCQAFELLLRGLGLNGDGATTLSSQVPSNVAFTLVHPFRLGPSYMAKRLYT